MRQFDPSLQRLRFLLLAICKHWKELRNSGARSVAGDMCDFARAAKVYVRMSSAADVPHAKRIQLIGQAEMFD